MVLVPEPEKLTPVLAAVLWPILTLLLLAEKSSVPVNAPATSEDRLTVVLTVTVPPPELPSNVAVSAAPGRLPAPPHVLPAPPLDDDHDAVLLPFQVAVPPTQKQEAACAGNDSARN